MKTIHAGKVASVLEFPSQYVLEIGDDVTTGDGDNRLTIPGFGELRARQALAAFQIFKKAGVPTHYAGAPYGQQGFFVDKAKPFDVEVVVRAVSAGSYAARTGIAKGTKLDWLTVEFFLKDDARHDPRIQFVDRDEGFIDECQLFKASSSTEKVGTVSYAKVFGGSAYNPAVYSFMALEAKRAFSILQYQLEQEGHILVDAKFEFGRMVGMEPRILMIDRFTGDEARIWWNGDPDCDVGKQPLRDQIKRVEGVGNLSPEFLARFSANYQLFAGQLEGIAQKLQKH